MPSKGIVTKEKITTIKKLLEGPEDSGNPLEALVPQGEVPNVDSALNGGKLHCNHWHALIWLLTWRQASLM